MMSLCLRLLLCSLVCAVGHGWYSSWSDLPLFLQSRAFFSGSCLAWEEEESHQQIILWWCIQTLPGRLCSSWMQWRVFGSSFRFFVGLQFSHFSGSVMLCCSELKCDYIIVVFLVFLGDMSWTFMLNTFHPLWTYFNTQSFAGTYFNTQSCSGLASTYEVATSKTDQSFHQFQKSLRNLLHLNCYCLWPWMTLLSSIKYVLF